MDREREQLFAETANFIVTVKVNALLWPQREGQNSVLDVREKCSAAQQALTLQFWSHTCTLPEEMQVYTLPKRGLH